MNNTYNDLHIDDFIDLVGIKCLRTFGTDKNSIKKDEALISDSIVASALFAERLKESGITEQRSQVIICDTSIFLMLYNFSLIGFENAEIKKQFEAIYTSKMINCLSEIFDIDANYLFSVISNRKSFYNQWFNDNNFLEKYEFIIELELHSDEIIIYHEDLPVPLLDFDVKTAVLAEFHACIMFYIEHSLKENVSKNETAKIENKTAKIENKTAKIENKTAKIENKTAKKEIKTKNTNSNGIIRLLIASAVLFCVVISVIIFNIPTDDNLTTELSTTKQTTQNTFTQKSESLPETGEIIINSDMLRESQITIKNSSTNCYVKLKDQNHNDVFGFFVRSNDTVTVDVPCGNYYVYFAYGDIWYGKYDLFGEKTYCSKDEDLQNFNDYAITYTLYNVSNGNFSPEYVSIEEFN